MKAVKIVVANLITQMDEETKASPVKRLVALLKKSQKIGDPRLYFENLLARPARLSAEEIAFCKFSREIVSIIPHACAVERVNKNHGNVHSKARAAAKSQTVGMQLYTLTNEALMHAVEEARAALVAESKKAACSATTEGALAIHRLDDAEAELGKLAMLDAHEYLPAERAEPAVAGGRRRRDSDDDDAMEESESDDDDEHIMLETFGAPAGFELMEKPDALLVSAELRGAYVLQYYDDQKKDEPGAWWLGALYTYHPRRRCNYTIEWRTNDFDEVDLKLEKYYDADETPKSGDWVYVTSKRLTTRKRPRAADDEDDDGSS